MLFGDLEIRRNLSSIKLSGFPPHRLIKSYLGDILQALDFETTYFSSMVLGALPSRNTAWRANDE